MDVFKQTNKNNIRPVIAVFSSGTEFGFILGYERVISVDEKEKKNIECSDICNLTCVRKYSCKRFKM